MENKSHYYYFKNKGRWIVKNDPDEDPKGMEKLQRISGILNDLKFQKEIVRYSGGSLITRLEMHLTFYIEAGGDEHNWVAHTKKQRPSEFSVEQERAFKDWINKKEKEVKKNKVVKVDALAMIEENMRASGLFETKEKAFLDDCTNFNKIRCATWCEALYDKKYILNSKAKTEKGRRDERIKIIKTFALNKYEIDIETQMQSSQKPKREKQYDHPTGTQKAIKFFFRK